MSDLEEKSSPVPSLRRNSRNAEIQQAMDVMMKAFTAQRLFTPRKASRLRRLSTIRNHVKSLNYRYRGQVRRWFCGRNILLFLLAIFGFAPFSTLGRCGRHPVLGIFGWLLALTYTMYSTCWLARRFWNDDGNFFDVDSTWDLQMFIFIIFNAHSVVYFLRHHKYLDLITKQIDSFTSLTVQCNRRRLTLLLMIFPAIFEFAHAIAVKCIKMYIKCYEKNETDVYTSCIDWPDQMRDSMYIYLMVRHNVALIAFAIACLNLEHVFKGVNQHIYSIKRRQSAVGEQATVSFELAENQAHNNVKICFSFVYMVWTAILALFILITTPKNDWKWTNRYYTLQHLLHATYGFMLYIMSSIKLNEKAKWIRRAAQDQGWNITLGHSFAVTRLTAITVFTACITLLTFWSKLQLRQLQQQYHTIVNGD